LLSVGPNATYSNGCFKGLILLWIPNIHDDSERIRKCLILLLCWPCPRNSLRISYLMTLTATRLFSVDFMISIEHGVVYESGWRKPLSVSVRPLQIADIWTGDRTGAAAAGSRPLATWATARLFVLESLTSRCRQCVAMKRH
jgi:hypothetical protein